MEHAREIVLGFLLGVFSILWFMQYCNSSRLREKFCGEKEVSCIDIAAQYENIIGGSIECWVFEEQYLGHGIKDVRIIGKKKARALAIECEKWSIRKNSNEPWKECDSNGNLTHCPPGCLEDRSFGSRNTYVSMEIESYFVSQGWPEAEGRVHRVFVGSTRRVSDKFLFIIVGLPIK